MRKLRLHHLLDHFRHPQQAALLQTLGRAHQDHRRRQVRQHGGVESPRVVRRHHAQDDLGALERAAKSVTT